MRTELSYFTTYEFKRFLKEKLTYTVAVVLSLLSASSSGRFEAISATYSFVKISNTCTLINIQRQEIFSTSSRSKLEKCHKKDQFVSKCPPM